MSTLVRDAVEQALEAGIINPVMYGDHVKKSLNGKNLALKGDAPFVRPKDLISLGREYLKVTNNVTSYNDMFLTVLGLLVLTQRKPNFSGEKFAQSVGSRLDKEPSSVVGKWFTESSKTGLIARIQFQAIEKGKLLDDTASLPSIKKDKELLVNNG